MGQDYIDEVETQLPGHSPLVHPIPPDCAAGQEPTGESPSAGRSGKTGAVQHGALIGEYPAGYGFGHGCQSAVIVINRYANGVNPLDSCRSRSDLSQLIVISRHPWRRDYGSEGWEFKAPRDPLRPMDAEHPGSIKTESSASRAALAPSLCGTWPRSFHNCHVPALVPAST